MNCQEMQGTVEEREGGALAGRPHRVARRELRSPFDIDRRQRAQRPRQLGLREVREVALPGRGEERFQHALQRLTQALGFGLWAEPLLIAFRPMRRMLALTACLVSLSAIASAQTTLPADL